MTDPGPPINFNTAKRTIVRDADLSLAIKDRSLCRHSRVSLDEDAHTVVCRGCGDTIDPFVVLMGYARDERNFKYSGAVARRELAEIRKSVADLKREERRIKGRLRTAKKGRAPSLRKVDGP